jgi:hypothetical protein
VVSWYWEYGVVRKNVWCSINEALHIEMYVGMVPNYLLRVFCVFYQYICMWCSQNLSYGFCGIMIDIYLYTIYHIPQIVAYHVWYGMVPTSPTNNPRLVSNMYST